MIRFQEGGDVKPDKNIWRAYGTGIATLHAATPDAGVIRPTEF